ncbi:GNAT family N-acetyltransferase [Flexivirga oryzae]|uniref:Putative acetyltransferase n=1 Tax=Flexivirga oryzae TaxID=1794944 RepID=A0A839NBL3_9MICO|nr:GNAT family N-acetyltransferase [Flexivirga oryzae]MBB2894239.1 putative acetyltransferase [Flexivirga oryzae]
MKPVIRELTDDDRKANHRLGAEAFGYGPDRRPVELPPAGGTVFGAFVDGRLTAKIRVSDYEAHLPGGRTRPVSGVEGVAVHAEARGRGLLTPLFRAGFERAQRMGQPVSVLFPTAAGIYRRFGYEIVGALEHRELPVSLLAHVAAPTSILLRRATAADVDTIRGLYAEWAAERLGPLTRTGPGEPHLCADYVADPASATLAVDDGGRIVGSVRWTRGTGYDPESSVIEVQDLIGLTPDATRALWRFLGSFGSVSGRVDVELPTGDESLGVLPFEPPPPVREHRCMIALLDIPGAFGARRGVPGLQVDLPFTVEGAFAAGVDGDYTLTAEGAGLRCEHGSSGAGPVFSARGLAALYGGAQRCSGLRLTGQLHGPVDHDPIWDALFNTPMQLRDYF